MTLGIALYNSGPWSDCIQIAWTGAGAELPSRELRFRARASQVRSMQHVRLMPRRSVGLDESINLDDRIMRLDTWLVQELVRLRQDAERRVGMRFRAATVAVPPCFQDRQRLAVRTIVEQSAIEEVAVINEPVALMKHYSEEGNWLALCFDMGMLYASLLNCTGNTVTELTCRFDMNWCGMGLATALAGAFGNRGHFPDLGAQRQALDAALQCIHDLRHEGTAPMGAELVTKFATESVVRVANLIEEALQRGGLKRSDLRGCLLIGSMWELPGIEQVWQGLSCKRAADTDIVLGAVIHGEERFGDAMKARAEPKLTGPSMPYPPLQPPDAAPDAMVAELPAQASIDPAPTPLPLPTSDDHGARSEEQVVLTIREYINRQYANERLESYRHLLEQIKTEAIEFWGIEAAKIGVTGDLNRQLGLLKEGIERFGPDAQLLRKLAKTIRMAAQLENAPLSDLLKEARHWRHQFPQNDQFKDVCQHLEQQNAQKRQANSRKPAPPGGRRA